MKMITLEVTCLVEDNKTGHDVQVEINDAIAESDATLRLEGYEWYNAEVTSERPYAVEA